MYCQCGLILGVIDLTQPWALLQGRGEWKGDRPAVWRSYFQKLSAQPNPGVFVDVGAGDGRFMSNTAFLEGHHCWRGIAVEPTDNEYPKLEKNRPGATTVRGVGFGG